MDAGGSAPPSSGTTPSAVPDAKLVLPRRQWKLRSAPARRPQREGSLPRLAAPRDRSDHPRARTDELDRRGSWSCTRHDQRGAPVGGEAGVGHRSPFVEGPGCSSRSPTRIARYTLRVFSPSRKSCTRALSRSAASTRRARSLSSPSSRSSCVVASVQSDRPALPGDVGVRAVETARPRVGIDVRGEEHDRQRHQSRVEGQRGVVGDERIESGKERSHVGSDIAPEAQDSLGGERRRVVARTQRVRPNEQHRTMTTQHVDELLPLLGRGNGGIRSPIAPGRRIEHEPVGRVRLTGRGPDRGARGGASGLGRPLREHVDARLPRHGHALVGQSECGLEATAHEMGRRRQHTDPVRRCRGTCDRGRPSPSSNEEGCRCARSRRSRGRCV